MDRVIPNDHKDIETHPALSAAVEAAIAAVGTNIVLGAPLGIGKPNTLLNAFFQHALTHPHIQLDIFTALSIALPAAKNDLKGRFIRHFVRRHFGPDYPQLAYLPAQKKGTLPRNIRITEFYLQPGSMLGKALGQQHYISSNYTHVARDMQSRGVNVICQMVGVRQTEKGPRYSFSSNPDVTLDLVDRLKHNQQAYFLIAVVNPHLPFMGDEAEVGPDYFDHIIDERAIDHQPYAIPRGQVSDADYAIGLYASTLIRDGGTLQIGIGSLGDALCRGLILRQQENQHYRQIIGALPQAQQARSISHEWGGLTPFQHGLYAASEMFLDGFIHLYEADILKRRVYDDVQLQALINAGTVSENIKATDLYHLHQAGCIQSPLQTEDIQWLQYWGFLHEHCRAEGTAIIDEQGHTHVLDPSQAREQGDQWQPLLGTKLKHGRVLHAAFFLGSRWFYDTLNAMDETQREQFSMCRVSRINQLYEGEAIDRVQRLDARFLNTCMKMTLLGAAVSDGLSDGQVVSGVGGQYNFIAMAHALDQGRSILMLRATRMGRNGLESNIVWQYPHTTIPRHLRDIVITEYGIADLRGKTDEEVIQALIQISDRRFQAELIHQAQKAGKLDLHWQCPDWCQNNTAAHLKASFTPYRDDLPPWPFGHDFTPDEFETLQTLQWLGQHQRKPGALWQAWRVGKAKNQTKIDGALKQILGLSNAWKDKMLLRLLRGAAILRRQG
jgi:acyl-CoA hydrolase